jgi:DNA-directed RNA polymerase specialized sigma24 family protein
MTKRKFLWICTKYYEELVSSLTSLRQQDAPDSVHNAIVKLLSNKKYTTVEGPNEKLVGWMMTVVKNEALNNIRKEEFPLEMFDVPKGDDLQGKQAMLQHSEESGNFTKLTPVYRMPSLDRVDIKRAYEQLSELAQMILYRNIIEGVSLKYIARELEEPYVKIKQEYHDAKQFLQRKLASYKPPSRKSQLIGSNPDLWIDELAKAEWGPSPEEETLP